MGLAEMHDIGGYIGATVRACDNVTVVEAGGVGDNTEVVGQIIDTAVYGPLSVAVLITWKAVLAAGKTLTLKNVAFEHSGDSGMSGGTDLSAPADVVVATDSGSGSTLRGCQKYKVDLAGCKRYVRLTFTPDLNATATDTAELAAVFIFGGQNKL